MTTLLFTHPSSLRHVTPNGHPERVDRIKAINQILASEHFKDLARREAHQGRGVGRHDDDRRRGERAEGRAGGDEPERSHAGETAK